MDHSTLININYLLVGNSKAIQNTKVLFHNLYQSTCPSLSLPFEKALLDTFICHQLASSTVVSLVCVYPLIHVHSTHGVIAQTNTVTYEQSDIY